MATIRRLIVLLLIVGLLWYAYGETYEKSGFQGVYNDIRTDIQEIRENEVFINVIETISVGIQFVSDRISESLPDRDTTPTINKPDLGTPSAHSFSIHNIELGDDRSKVEAEVGQPKRASRNEYGVDWVTYHENYQNFIMVAYDERDQVIGLYTNQDLLASTNGITFDSTRDEVLSILPKPLKEIRKGLINYQIMSDNEYHMFEINESYVTIFYDEHRNTQVTAILIIHKEMEDRKRKYFAKPSEELRKGFEYQLFDLTNAVRVKHGLPILTWEEAARETVRAHSQDMAENNYFSHTNLDGLSPFDRLTEDAISYQMAGENLATGQTSSIFAHEGLMNSLGHRENKLGKGYRSLVVGVAFNHESQPFYTENYLTRDRSVNAR